MLLLTLRSCGAAARRWRSCARSATACARACARSACLCLAVSFRRASAAARASAVRFAAIAAMARWRAACFAARFASTAGVAPPPSSAPRAAARPLAAGRLRRLGRPRRPDLLAGHGEAVGDHVGAARRRPRRTYLCVLHEPSWAVCLLSWSRGHALIHGPAIVVSNSAWAAAPTSATCAALRSTSAQPPHRTSALPRNSSMGMAAGFISTLGFSDEKPFGSPARCHRKSSDQRTRSL